MNRTTSTTRHYVMKRAWLSCGRLAANLHVRAVEVTTWSAPASDRYRVLSRGSHSDVAGEHLPAATAAAPIPVASTSITPSATCDNKILKRKTSTRKS